MHKLVYTIFLLHSYLHLHFSFYLLLTVLYVDAQLIIHPHLHSFHLGTLLVLTFVQQCMYLLHSSIAQAEIKGTYFPPSIKYIPDFHASVIEVDGVDACIYHVHICAFDALEGNFTLAYYLVFVPGLQQETVVGGVMREDVDVLGGGEFDGLLCGGNFVTHQRVVKAEPTHVEVHLHHLHLFYCLHFYPEAPLHGYHWLHHTLPHLHHPFFFPPHNAHIKYTSLLLGGVESAELKRCLSVVHSIFITHEKGKHIHLLS